MAVSEGYFDFDSFLKASSYVQEYVMFTRVREHTKKFPQGVKGEKLSKDKRFAHPLTSKIDELQKGLVHLTDVVDKLVDTQKAMHDILVSISTLTLTSLTNQPAHPPSSSAESRSLESSLTPFDLALLLQQPSDQKPDVDLSLLQQSTDMDTVDDDDSTMGRIFGGSEKNGEGKVGIVLDDITTWDDDEYEDDDEELNGTFKTSFDMNHPSISFGSASVDAQSRRKKRKMEKDKDDCSISIMDANGLERHKFVCTYEGCNSSYTLRRLWQWHLKLHEDPDAFQCKECHSRFSNPDNLKTHVRGRSRANGKMEKCPGRIIKTEKINEDSTKSTSSNSDDVAES